MLSEPDDSTNDWWSTNIAYYSTPEAVDTYADRASDGLLDHEAQAIHEYFTKDGACVLDVGCGTGRTTTRLDELGYDVVGVDISEPLVEEARRQFPDLDVRVGDATALEFDDETFEYVLFSNRGIDDLYPKDRRHAAFREIRRVLTPHGRFAFSTKNAVVFYLLRGRSNPRKLLQFWRRNAAMGQLRSPYKHLSAENESDWNSYFISPWRQKRQLRQEGFEPLSVVPKESFHSAYSDPSPYYVAQKI